MISPSLARATWTGAHPCLLCSVSTRVVQASQATSSSPFPGRNHRRASSKASNPPNDNPRPIATPSNSAAAETRKPVKEEAEQRPDTRSSPPKSKGNVSTKAEKVKGHSTSRLPFVPSTQHLHPHDVYAASFFSIHRPMSVTAFYPSTSSVSSFCSIFSSPQPQKSKPADVIYTLSSAVKSLENGAGHRRNQIQSTSSRTASQRTDVQAIISEASASGTENTAPNNDSNQLETIHLSIEKVVENFRPFNVPPAPIPIDLEEESSHQVIPAHKGSEEAASTKQKSFSTIVTIFENSHPDGSKSYSAQTSPIREDSTEEGVIRDSPPQGRFSELALPGPQPFLQRMLDRQEKWDDFREETGRNIWSTISVKRQRRLKMKKHKYKKLMRRTRNLRRRQDRL